jgi:uncharacterized protein YbcC (UPF0753/DUF2309 family)
MPLDDELNTEILSMKDEHKNRNKLKYSFRTLKHLTVKSLRLFERSGNTNTDTEHHTTEVLNYRILNFFSEISQKGRELKHF